MVSGSKDQSLQTFISLRVMNEELLIEIVKRHPQLYDRNDKYYHDLTRTKNAWEIVSQVVNFSASECKRKWNSLRDNYRKHLKKYNTKNGEASQKIKQWKHQETMSFLIPFFTEREQQSNILPERDLPNMLPERDLPNMLQERELPKRELSNMLPERELPNILPEEEVHDVKVEVLSEISQVSSCEVARTDDELSSSFSNINTPICKKRSVSSVTDVLENYLNNKQAKVDTKPADALRKFFDTIEETVRSFNPLLQIELKSKIFALVTEYELRNMNSEASNEQY